MNTANEPIRNEDDEFNASVNDEETQATAAAVAQILGDHLRGLTTGTDTNTPHLARLMGAELHRAVDHIRHPAEQPNVSAQAARAELASLSDADIVRLRDALRPGSAASAEVPEPERVPEPLPIPEPERFPEPEPEPERFPEPETAAV